MNQILVKVPFSQLQNVDKYILKINQSQLSATFYRQKMLRRQVAEGLKWLNKVNTSTACQLQD